MARGARRRDRPWRGCDGERLRRRRGPGQDVGLDGDRDHPGRGKKTPADTSDRGARRCAKTAFLAALLADVDRLAFDVSEVRCKGSFARTRFVARGCAPGQATKVPCGSARIGAWRLGAKRWRLIAYKDQLSCGEIRRAAADFPQSLCN